MIKLDTIKGIGGIVVGVGVSTIMSNIVKEHTSEEEGALKKLCIWAGGIVLASMVCDKATKYLNHNIDQIAEATKKVVDENKKEE